MEWQGGRRSDNVDSVGRGGGLGRPLAFGGGAVGIIGAILFYLLTGQVPDIQQAPAPGQVGTQAQGPRTAAEQQQREFVSVVLASTEDTWSTVLPQQARIQYQPPRLTLFEDAVESACGFAQAAMGPFYCPADQRVYLDLSFFNQLSRMGAPGEFARAYVIAHEVGHHVQNLLGIERRVMQLRRSVGSREDSNALSVLTELQADCYAGVWAHHANANYKSSGKEQLIQPNDIESGLAAAASVGDDRLQRQSRGYVSPESFTHGSSAQRVSWFKTGMQTGELRACDTFGKAGVRL
ncbi:MAG TPA: neutral zinc metallopeptidase [Myxococcaceae bacterium]|nr:neutral zinc metallopeptidase [Myxococcaceae bacterium]